MEKTPTFSEEAERIYERYAKEFVEELNLCPWAMKARADGKARSYILDSIRSLENLDETEAMVDEVAANPEVEVGLLIFPALASKDLSHVERRSFERFVAKLRERHAKGKRAVMAMAAFHPEGPLDATSPQRLVSFIRRSPDPTIQLIRLSVLNSIRKPEDQGTGYLDPAKLASFDFTKPRKKPLHARVAQSNHDSLVSVGFERAEAILADIAQDRLRSYPTFLCD